MKTYMIVVSAVVRSDDESEDIIAERIEKALSDAGMRELEIDVSEVD